jgi:uncharacterized protein
MKLEGEGKLLRIFIGESDKSGHTPLYEAIVRAARERGLAGATVLRGIEGFGASSRLHTARFLRLSEDLPLVIEIVDTAEKIDAFIEEIDEVTRPHDQEWLNGRQCGGDATHVRVYLRGNGHCGVRRRHSGPGPGIPRRHLYPRIGRAAAIRASGRRTPLGGRTSAWRDRGRSRERCTALGGN